MSVATFPSSSTPLCGHNIQPELSPLQSATVAPTKGNKAKERYLGYEERGFEQHGSVALEHFGDPVEGLLAQQQLCSAVQFARLYAEDTVIRGNGAKEE